MQQTIIRVEVYLMVRIVRRLLVAALALAAAAPPVMASSMNFYPGGSITSSSLGAVTFESGLGFRVTCNVELTGSFASGLLPATEGTRYGSLTRAEMRSCSGGTVRSLIEARSPWSLTYKLILGTLPNPTGLELYISSARLLIEIPGVASCLYEARLGWLTSLERFGTLRFSLRLARVLETDETIRLLTTLSGFCSSSGSITGTFSFSPEQIMELEALVQPGVLRLEPNPILIPKREGGNPNWRRMPVRVTNGAMAGSEDLIVVANTINFFVGDEFQVIANNCGGQTLRANGANECTITVEYLGAEELNRIGTLSVSWVPVANTRINTSQINAATN